VQQSFPDESEILRPAGSLPGQGVGLGLRMTEVVFGVGTGPGIWQDIDREQY